MDSDLAERYQILRHDLVASISAITRNIDIAEDSVDEAFARAVRHWPRVSRMRSPNGWIYRVALNAAIRAQRRRGLEQRVLRRVREPTQSPESVPEFWLLIRLLPPRQRIAIALRYVGQLSEQEIAGAMGVKRGTVSATLRAAHDRLRSLLSAEEDMEGGTSHDRREAATHGLRRADSDT